MTMPNEGMERAVGGDPRITPQQLAAARQRVRWGSGLSRTELARTICEPWGWVTASGSYKVTAGWKVLAEWAARGLRRLPGKRRITRGHTDRACGAVRPQRTEPGAPLVGERSVAGPVELEVIQSRRHGQRWNEYVDRYRYLGYRQPFGCHLRYFRVRSAGVLGWVLLAGAAKALAARDQWIGWDRRCRPQNWPWGINPTRLLIFPGSRSATSPAMCWGNWPGGGGGTGQRAGAMSRCGWKPASLRTGSPGPATVPPVGRHWPGPRAAAWRGRGSPTLGCRNRSPFVRLRRSKIWNRQLGLYRKFQRLLSPKSP